MVMIEMDIVLRPSTFLHITMVEYARSTQGPLKMIVKGSVKRKIQNSHQGCLLYPYQNHPYYSYTCMPPHPHPSMTIHPNPKIPTHPHPNIPQHTICLCTYFTTSTMNAPYAVPYHPTIPFLGDLNSQPQIILPHSLSKKPTSS